MPPSDAAARKPNENDAFRCLADSTTVGFWQISREGYTEYLNPAMCQMLEVDGIRELTGRTFHSCFTPETLGTVVAEHAKRWFGQSSSYEAVLVGLKTGRRHNVLVGGSPVISAQGELLGMLGTVTDLTEARLTRAQLEASEQRFRIAMESSQLGMALVEALSGRFVEVNSALASMLGFSRAELLGKTFQEVTHPDDVADALVQQRAIVAEQRRTTSYRKRYLAKDGRVVWANVNVSALQVPSGETQYAFAQVEDLTSRRELEMQLAQADRLSALGLLAAGVAHEINNPLTYVLANLEALVGTSSLQPEAARRLHEAVDGARRISSIVKDLKVFSRAEADERYPFQVNAAIECALSLAANVVGYRATVVRSLSAVPLVNGNEGRLTQVFLNLLVNAAQALEEGHPERNEIRVSSRLEGPEVVVEVSDTGPGMDPSVLSRIFEPFFSTKPKGEGSGLGLSICKSIVESTGGNIELRSEPGKGTTAVVRLPRLEATAPAPAPVAPTPSEPITRRSRVLIVDDEPLICSALRRILSSGSDVVVAGSGTSAKALLATDRAFDAIFCDVMMPGVSGFELHAHLLAMAPELASRMIFMTGGAFSPQASEFLKRVENRTLEKPFQSNAARDALASVLQRAH